jgi:hypothetical protein
MRPSTTIFTHGGDLPGHLWDLRAQLGGGGAQAPPDAMGFATALVELRHVCASAAVGRFMRAHDRQSLVEDLGRSIAAIGPLTAGAAAPELADFRSELSRLSTHLDSAEGARAVVLSLESLSAALRRPVVAVAAWRDLVAAFEDENMSPEICETLMRNLRELVDLRGHLWAPQGLASGLEIVLGDVVANTSELPATPLDERLARCEELISAQPRVADSAVWFVFDHADLTSNHLSSGPLLLVPGGLVPGGFAPGRVLHDVGPLPELEYWEDAESHLTQVPQEHVVLARVWLPNTFVDQAPRKARTLLESLIEMANPGSRWTLYDGHMVWSGGEHFWGSSFLDEAQWERDSPPVSPMFEGTDRRLTDFKAEFVQRLADDDPSALEAVEDVRWTISLRRTADAAQRVALGTRALERTLGVARASKESWLDVTTRFLKAPWVRLTLGNEMLDAAVAATSGLPGRYTHNAAQYREILDGVLPEREPGLRMVNHAELAKVHAACGHLWEANAFSGRIVREACAVLTDPQAALALLVRLEARFDRLVARTERQRNSLIHGTRPAYGVLNTIDRFVNDLNAYMAQESLRTAESGQTPLQELEHWRVAALLRRQKLEQGNDPVEVLFSDA